MSDNTPSIQAVLGLGVVAALGAGVFIARDSLDWAEWGPPLVVFGGAVVGGLGLAFTMGRDEAEASQVEAAGHREDLERRRLDALEALAHLESQKSQMSPEDYAAERKSLLARGADAMRQLEGAAPRTAPSAPQPTSPRPSGAPVSQPNPALAAGIAQLTEALTKGEIDAVTYGKAVAALSSATVPAADAQPAPAAPPADDPAPVAPTTDAAPAPVPVATPIAAPAPPPPAGLAPQWTGAIYAVVGLALIGTLLYFVQNEAAPRAEGAGMTGNQELSSGSNQTPPASSEAAFMQQAKDNAKAALAANGKDLDALNTLTQLNFQNPQQAWTYNQKAREVDPTNPDALVFEAVITTIMGMPEKAQEKFDAVLAANPEHGPGWAYKGLTLMEAKQYTQAIPALEKAVALGVKDQSIVQALSIARSGGAGAGAMPPMPKANGSSPVVVSGTVALDPSRADYQGKVVFVAIKDPAMPGPPLASVKLPPGPFPMDFTVTEADKIPMMGNRPIPPNVIVQVRLDADGQAMPRNASDPIVQLEGVAAGTTGMNLTMK